MYVTLAYHICLRLSLFSTFYISFAWWHCIFCILTMRKKMICVLWYGTIQYDMICRICVIKYRTLCSPLYRRNFNRNSKYTPQKFSIMQASNSGEIKWAISFFFEAMKKTIRRIKSRKVHLNLRRWNLFSIVTIHHLKSTWKRLLVILFSSSSFSSIHVECRWKWEEDAMKESEKFNIIIGERLRKRERGRGKTIFFLNWILEC